MKNFSSLLISFLMVPFLLNAQAPEIDVWYGDNQKFGHLGQAQDQINILGRISDPQGTSTITTFLYTLNGSAARDINIGPDSRRLDREGDFNIEIFSNDASLNPSAPFPTSNTVLLIAIDEDSNTITDTVIFEYTGNVAWNLPYSIDWDTVTNIQNVVQVTDGKWEIETYITGEKGIRINSSEYAYDRAVILGESTWENYEVLVKAKINVGYPENGGTALGAFLGFVPRWTGHTDSPSGASGFDPKAGWEPSGEFVGYSYVNTFGNHFYKLGEIDNTAITPVVTDTEYYKLRLQSDIGQNYYAFKHWKITDSEPSSWTLDGFIDDTLDANAGSVLLLAHNIDAVFGDISISSLPALPVELISFNAQTNQVGEIILSWETATEVNNYGFEVERTSGNSELQWTTVGFVKGNGNSSSPKNYSFTDHPNYSSKYYYRLKQIDNDGSYEYSNLVEVIMNAPSVYALAQNFPNPFNPSTTIEFTIPEESRVSLIIYNALGQEVTTLNEGILAQGNHSVLFDASSLSSGNYIFVLTGNSIANNSEFRIVKKMTVLK
jgi:hypothetical protein